MTDKFVIAVSVADVRRDPDPNSELVTQALLNVPVRVGDVQGEWTHVTLSDYTGWVRSDELELPIVRGYCEGEGTCGVPLPYSVVVTALRTPLYQDEQSSATKGEMYLSTVLPYVDLEHPGRVRVALPGDNEAWVERADIELRSNTELFPPQSTSIVTSYARAFLERPYLWGGTSWRGIDCSAFVQLCYRMGGVILPRDADQQHDSLPRTIAQSEMQAGDLIFFGEKDLTHVGLVLGPEEFIHADGTDYHQVWINSLNPASPLYNAWRAATVWAIKRVRAQETR
jgi:cell wall-associated NlpC family hydrolase